MARPRGLALADGIAPASWPNFNALVDQPLAQPQVAVKGAVRTPEPDVDPTTPAVEGIVTATCVDMLDRKRQVILYGPPGTGKTYWAAAHAARGPDRAPHLFAMTVALSDRRARHGVRARRRRPVHATCTFHPTYSYEDFIEGYRPEGRGLQARATASSRGW